MEFFLSNHNHKGNRELDPASITYSISMHTAGKLNNLPHTYLRKGRADLYAIFCSPRPQDTPIIIIDC